MAMYSWVPDNAPALHGAAHGQGGRDRRLAHAPGTTADDDAGPSGQGGERPGGQGAAVVASNHRSTVFRLATDDSKAVASASTSAGPISAVNSMGVWSWGSGRASA